MTHQSFFSRSPANLFCVDVKLIADRYYFVDDDLGRSRFKGVEGGIDHLAAEQASEEVLVCSRFYRSTFLTT